MVDLLHHYTYVKMTLDTVVENALSVAHNLPDHNHNAQEAKRTFERVSPFDFSLNCFVEYKATVFLCCAALLPLVVVSCHALCTFQHEAVYAELREKQEDMDQLISTVEDLERELKKVPKSEGWFSQKDTDALRNKWLEVRSAS